MRIITELFQKKGRKKNWRHLWTKRKSCIFQIERNKRGLIKETKYKEHQNLLKKKATNSLT